MLRSYSKDLTEFVDFPCDIENYDRGQYGRAGLEGSAEERHYDGQVSDYKRIGQENGSNREDSRRACADEGDVMECNTKSVQVLKDGIEFVGDL